MHSVVCASGWEHLPKLHKACGSSIGTAKNKIHKTEPSEEGQHADAHNASNQSTKIKP